MSTSSNFLSTAWAKAWGVWFITVFAFMAILTGLFVVLLPGQTRRRKAARFGARQVFRLTGSWPEVSGLELLPDEPAVVVANHASYLDGILLTAVLPHNFQFVIKREITEIPGVHFFLRRIGSHFVERFDVRKSANDARRIIQTATSGGSLGFFPEGTFRKEPGLRRFQNGAFTIAVRQGLPLVPLTLSGTRSMLPAHSWLPRPANLAVKLAAPVYSGDQNAATVRDNCRQQILASLDEPDLLAAAAAD